MYRNSEGYADPTAGQALANIMRDRKRERSKRRKAERKQKDLIQMNKKSDSGKEHTHENE